jgi:hemerythrin-like domain-containing protein
MGEKTTMEATEITPQIISCGGPLPELEIPMINTMVNCLTIEHRRLDELNMQLAYAATGLAGDPGAVATYRRAIEAWDEIQGRLWSHLQIEDQLVLTWGRAHQAISDEMIDSLAAEHQKIRELVGALPAWSSDPESERSAEDRAKLAHTLLALAQTLDSHVERHEAEILPAILRALFRQ